MPIIAIDYYTLYTNKVSTISTIPIFKLFCSYGNSEGRQELYQQAPKMEYNDSPWTTR